MYRCELDHKEGWALKNLCFWTVVLEKTLESPLDYKEIKPVNPKGNQSCIFTVWCWSWSSNTLATWWEKLTHWKRSWCWERQKAGGEGDDRGWDGQRASPTQWMWIWASFETVEDRGLHAAISGEAESVGHDSATDQQQQQSFLWLLCWRCLKELRSSSSHFAQASPFFA